MSTRSTISLPYLPKQYDRFISIKKEKMCTPEGTCILLIIGLMIYTADQNLGEKWLVELIDETYISPIDIECTRLILFLLFIVVNPTPSLRRSDKERLSAIIGKPSYLACFLSNVLNFQDPELPLPPYELVVETNNMFRGTISSTFSTLFISSDSFDTFVNLSFKLYSDGWKCINWLVLLSSLQSIEKVQDESINFLFNSLANRPSNLSVSAQKIILKDVNSHSLFKYSNLKSAENCSNLLNQLDSKINNIAPHLSNKMRTSTLDVRNQSSNSYDFKPKMKSVKSYSSSISNIDEDFETKLKKFQSQDMREILPQSDNKRPTLAVGTTKTKGKSFLSRLGGPNKITTPSDNNLLVADFNSVTAVGIKTFKQKVKFSPISSSNEEAELKDPTYGL